MNRETTSTPADETREAVRCRYAADEAALIQELSRRIAGRNASLLAAVA